nr:sodium/solute symporter [Deinobacterium chartae]
MLFLVIVGLTLIVTYFASRATKSASDFYVGGRSITAGQNGLAIAGDYLSAASFLGIAGLIALSGFDGFMYSVGFFVAYLVVLFVVAEPLRNVGKYTIADVLDYRLKNPRVRTFSALSTFTITTFYMIAQVVGAGALISLLSGGVVPPTFSIPLVGVMMIVYVVFGGMLATTWVQIIKAVLLMLASLIMSLMVLGHFDWSLSGLLGEVADRYGNASLNAGLKYTNPIDLISLGLALVLGTAGLPHILVRFYTVPTAQAARMSIVWAMVIIGAFYVLTMIMGNGAAVLVGREPIVAANAAGNMAAPLLAQTLGGELFLAFVSAVAFATILAVVAGLTITASTAVAHDIYNSVLRGGQASEVEQVRVARLATIVIGVLAIVLGILAKDQNVAFLVALAFAVAASANLPVILYALFWRRFNTGGAIAGIVGGIAVSLILIALSPNIMGVDPPEKTAARHLIQAPPIFPLENPGIVSIPAGFLCAYLGTVLTARRREEEEAFDEMHVRAYTGLGAE